MENWCNKRVLVTGGSGFIGSHLVGKLVEAGARVRVVGRKQKDVWHPDESIRKQVSYLQGDLKSINICLAACQEVEVLFHLAAVVGGIGYNFPHPATLYAENLLPGISLLTEAQKMSVQRVILVSSACVYPRNARIPTPEEDGFLEDPEEGNLGYGWGKRALELYGRFLMREFSSPIVMVRPFNAYGPRDDFSKEKSHVIPALFKKALAVSSSMEIWGDGKPTRAFVYVDDIVRGLLLAAEKGPLGVPMNLGTEEEVSIGELARKILDVCGVQKVLKFDPTKPGGQPRRTCDTTKAQQLIGFRAEVSLEEGLRRTHEWISKHPEVLSL